MSGMKQSAKAGSSTVAKRSPSAFLQSLPSRHKKRRQLKLKRVPNSRSENRSAVKDPSNIESASRSSSRGRSTSRSNSPLESASRSTASCADPVAAKVTDAAAASVSSATTICTNLLPTSSTAFHRCLVTNANDGLKDDADVSKKVTFGGMSNRNMKDKSRNGSRDSPEKLKDVSIRNHNNFTNTNGNHWDGISQLSMTIDANHSHDHGPANEDMIQHSQSLLGSKSASNIQTEDDLLLQREHVPHLTEPKNQAMNLDEPTMDNDCHEPDNSLETKENHTDIAAFTVMSQSQPQTRTPILPTTHVPLPSTSTQSLTQQIESLVQNHAQSYLQNHKEQIQQREQSLTVQFRQQKQQLESAHRDELKEQKAKHDDELKELSKQISNLHSQATSLTRQISSLQNLLDTTREEKNQAMKERKEAEKNWRSYKMKMAHWMKGMGFEMDEKTGLATVRFSFRGPPTAPNSNQTMVESQGCRVNVMEIQESIMSLDDGECFEVCDNGEVEDTRAREKRNGNNEKGIVTPLDDTTQGSDSTDDEGMEEKEEEMKNMQHGIGNSVREGTNGSKQATIASPPVSTTSVKLEPCPLHPEEKKTSTSEHVLRNSNIPTSTAASEGPHSSKPSPSKSPAALCSISKKLDYGLTTSSECQPKHEYIPATSIEPTEEESDQPKLRFEFKLNEGDSSDSESDDTQSPTKSIATPPSKSKSSPKAATSLTSRYHLSSVVSEISSRETTPRSPSKRTKKDSGDGNDNDNHEAAIKVKVENDDIGALCAPVIKGKEERTSLTKRSGSDWLDRDASPKRPRQTRSRSRTPPPRSATRHDDRPKASGSKSSPATKTPSASYKFQEVVRGKKAREKMPGFDCEECNAFFNAICSGKGGQVFNRDKMIQRCSRHRSKHTPPQTPEGFWEMSFADEVAARKTTEQEEERENDSAELSISY